MYFRLTELKRIYFKNKNMNIITLRMKSVYKKVSYCKRGSIAILIRYKADDLINQIVCNNTKPDESSHKRVTVMLKKASYLS